MAPTAPSGFADEFLALLPATATTLRPRLEHAAAAARPTSDAIEEQRAWACLSWLLETAAPQLLDAAGTPRAALDAVRADTAHRSSATAERAAQRVLACSAALEQAHHVTHRPDGATDALGRLSAQLGAETGVDAAWEFVSDTLDVGTLPTCETAMTGLLTDVARGLLHRGDSPSAVALLVADLQRQACDLADALAAM